MNTVKKVGSVVVSVILWIIILLAALYAFVTLATRDANHLANIGGVSPLVIESNSMAPTFEQGDLIFIKQCDPAKLEVGDVITFHTIIENEYALNTHRIIDIAEENGVRQYTTQGDNNAVSDPHIITDGDIAGKYMNHIPKMGVVINFLSGKIGFFIIIVIPMLLFFIYQLYHLIMVAIELKKAAAIEAATEAAEAVERQKREKEEAQAKAEAEKKEAEAKAEAEKKEAQAKEEAEKKEAIQAEADEAERMKAEAAKALEEAKRLQAEAEEALKKAKAMQEEAQE